MKSIKSRPASSKHIPQRTCVACHKIKAKRALVHLVRIVGGSVQVDTSGKKSGRGAYLCQVWGCWEVGLKGNRLEHALRTTLAPENREQLIQYGESLTGVGQ